MLLLDEPLAGVDPASAQLIDELFGELRGEGRALLVSSHDVESARGFDRVLCLNGEQVAFGPPARDARPRDARGHLRPRADRPRGAAAPARAVTVQHHEHDEADLSGIELRATLEVVLAGGFCGALGFWVLSERLSYAGESLSHGLLPGLVLAALAGAPLLLGAAGGALVAAALIALAARDARGRARHRHRGGRHRARRARARCSRSSPTRRSASRSCCSAIRSG